MNEGRMLVPNRTLSRNELVPSLTSIPLLAPTKNATPKIGFQYNTISSYSGQKLNTPTVNRNVQIVVENIGNSRESLKKRNSESWDQQNETQMSNDDTLSSHRLSNEKI